MIGMRSCWPRGSCTRCRKVSWLGSTSAVGKLGSWYLMFVCSMTFGLFRWRGGSRGERISPSCDFDGIHQVTALFHHASSSEHLQVYTSFELSVLIVVAQEHALQTSLTLYQDRDHTRGV